MLNIRLPFIRSSYYPPSLVEKYVSSSYRSYKSGGPVAYAVTTDPSFSGIFTFNTNLKVQKGDLIVTFQWYAGYAGFQTIYTPSDNLGTNYTGMGTSSSPSIGLNYTLGGNINCGSYSGGTAMGSSFWGIAPAAGTLSIRFAWGQNPNSLPAYAVFVFRGQTFNGNIYFPNNGGITATGGSASISTSGLPSTTYHTALLVALVTNQPCFNALPSISAQGFTQALVWGDACFEVCSSPFVNQSDALLYAYKYSPQDFTFDLEFTYQGTTVYGYAIALV